MSKPINVEIKTDYLWNIQLMHFFPLMPEDGKISEASICSS